MKQTRNVFLTAGHRGGVTGANANGYHEGEETIRLRNAISERLHSKGIVCITDDDNASLTAVIKQINKKCTDRDICIDIHFNSSIVSSANGTEVFIPNYPSNIEIELAEDILNATCSSLGTKNRGVKKEGNSQYARLAMLSDVKCNSMLLEVCFLSNKGDCEKYDNNYDILVRQLESVITNFATL